jgi:hypothetical protein
MRSGDKRYVSPSRTYVMTINKSVVIEDRSCYIGHRFVKFMLPEFHPCFAETFTPLENNAVTASWYYLNILDPFSYVGEIYTAEDFSELTDKTL